MIMDLPSVTDFSFQEKSVLLRGDLDVPLKNGKVEENSRLKECLPTIQYLLDNDAKVVLIGHLGRPEGKVVEELRLKPVAQKLDELLNSKIKDQKSKTSIRQAQDRQIKIKNFEGYQIAENLILLENLRFDPGEEANDSGFAKELADLGDFFVNEAFATSHRLHASIVGIPKLLAHAAGFHFTQEVENLSKVLENPKRPLVFVIGGAKPETKLPLVVDFAKKADWILIGGTLSQNSKPAVAFDAIKSILFAGLTSDGFDINEESIKKFTDIIKTAGTIVWNGPMGKYEEEKYEIGTRKIVEAIAENQGFSVVGGGDTIAALTKFNLIDKMDYVSTGGGAMLEFLAQGTLPGIEALK